jgi:FKBP-type peptidyl-prolyl cis-trans isomerase
MKLLLSVFTLILLFSNCAGDSSEEKVDLKTFKDKISYALGADHARAISESGDPNYDKYNFEKLIDGFIIGLKNSEAFDKDCRNTLMKLYGENGREFHEKFSIHGSECVGKLSGSIFHASWKKNKALNKIDLEKVIIGFKHGIAKKDTLVKREEQAMMIQSFMFDVYKLNGLEMIEKAKKINGALIHSSGIVVETIEQGTGTKPAKGDDVLAHYILMNATGDTLQNSYDIVKIYKQPLTAFSLNSVIPGWQEGMPLLNKGGKYKLYIPYHLAYGETGMYNPQSKSYDIQPYQSLVFFIELINHGKSGSLTKK